MAEIQIIHLEDDPLDGELVLARLQSDGLACRVRRVQTREAFMAALAEGPCDLVLADYSLPQYDGMAALRLVREQFAHLPFIFVTGALGEELAIETLRSGATDYVLKHRLERLQPAVMRALREVEERAERERMAEELARRAERLAEADRRKDEFLAMLAHELRNPLAPIMTALHILRQQPPADPRTARFQEMMDRQVRHLVRLVDDLLDISRITQGKITLHKAPLELGDLVRQVVDTMRPMAQDRREQLVVTPAPAELWIEGDSTRLEQVLQNLLNNAVKYTPEGGRIELRVAQEGEQAVLSVRDSGLGIPADILPQVFDLFVQARQTLDRSSGGLGIGLTLVRNLVQMHGGTVEAASAGPGQGSQFTVRLPLLYTRPFRPGAKDPGQAGPDNVPADAPAARSALIVDDNTDAAHTLADLLQAWGYQVYLAYDGPVALESAREYQPDIVLLDIGLPGMDGYEVARQLRREPGSKTTLLVAVSGYGQEEDRHQAQLAGFDYHFTKPIDLDALMRSLQEGPPER